MANRNISSISSAQADRLYASICWPEIHSSLQAKRLAIAQHPDCTVTAILDNGPMCVLMYFTFLFKVGLDLFLHK